ncbi:MFS transporter [Streptomyces hainanensis]|uniref:MFS transporter n=1 Tax=Streptomyces hainanensis TaxID=402648 RepID=A0A4R4SWU8_9ACTN|nr:MFS transporter [Streptomyces hainanensis]TDC66679.1 MFS transporter [Streptomyces hainanensis]
MTVDLAPAPGPTERRARVAVAALFFTNGALFANLVPRFPQIKSDLGIDNATYGLAVAAFPAGAIAAGLAAGILIRRLGSARVAVVGTVLTGAGALVAGTAPSVAAFAGALLLAGAMDAITDVAQNAHGLRVQRRYGRSIINGLHAVWSVGAVTGGAMAAGAMALDLSPGAHLGTSVILFSAVALVALRFCLPGSEARPDDAPAAASTGAGSAANPARRRTALVLSALVVVAIAGALVEDAGSSWAGVYLADSLHAPAALAASGYVAMVGAQFVGRLVGDRLVDRFGQRAVARAGGLVAASGMGLALAFPTVPGTLLGFAAAGLGVATLVPAAMHEADELPGLRPGVGLTVVSWLLRLGFLCSPPLVGLVADATEVRLGLLVVPAAGLLALGFAGVLRPRRPVAPAPDRAAAPAVAARSGEPTP